MKQVYLIRHAKSSWVNPDLDDFDRPLNGRGKRNAPEMARRLGVLGICPDLIVSSPAKRARKTAVCMAEGTGYKKKNIIFDENLYIGSLPYHLHAIAKYLKKTDTLFIVGHNHIFTELADHLTGNDFENVPTCGIVGIGYAANTKDVLKPGAGKLLFFDFPKNTKKIFFKQQAGLFKEIVKS